VSRLRLDDLARVAEAAADRARAEILPRFRAVEVERKADGSPVTEADRAAERAIREVLRAAHPEIRIVGEEYGAEGPPAGPAWLVDPIDGTIAFARGIPLFATLVALVEDDEPLLGLIDLPTLGERYVGWRRGGCRRNGRPVRVSTESELRRALVARGDRFCFERAGKLAAVERLDREALLVRSYTDAFGHAQVLAGGIDAMVDFDLNPWDAAATRVLVPEAGGACAVLPQPNAKLGLVFGSPPLVERLLELVK
jgi:histidinol-phosphatase